MKQRCIDAVEAVAGRKLTAAEVRKIEEIFKRELRNLAKEDGEKFHKMSEDERFAEAAKRSAETLVAEARKEKQRLTQTLAAHDRIETFLQDAQSRGISGFDALKRYVATDVDGKSGVVSLEAEIKAVRVDYLRQMLDVWEATDPRIFGLFEDKEGVTALLYEIKGQDSSKGVNIDGTFTQINAAKSAAAKKAAQVWKEQTDAMKEEFNSQGGKVGTLEDWGLPHHHSPARLLKAGIDKWLEVIAPKIDKTRYVKEDGTLMTDMEIDQLLRAAFETIVSGGANKRTPGRPSIGGNRSNRFSEERVLHFKTADDYLEYQRDFGEKDLYGVLVGHVSGMSREIAVARKLGPNADQTMRYFMDRAHSRLAVEKGEGAANEELRRTQYLYDFVAGRRQPIVNYKIANGFDSLRSWMVASRLGSMIISMLPDQGTMYLSAAVNKLRGTDLFANQMRMLDPTNSDHKRMAQRAGLALDAMLGSLNRFGQDNLGRSFADKMAGAVLRVQGAEALQSANQAAFGVTMLSSIGHNLTKYAKLSDMHPMDRRILESYGVTDADWAVWKKAELENWGNGAETVITPDAIYAIDGLDEGVIRDAGRKLLAVVNAEVDMAILQPGARERVAMQTFLGQSTRGTWGGEIWRSVLLFKSFPIAMIMRHWRRGMNMPTRGGKAAYIASLVATTTILGAVSVQIGEILNGKDPHKMLDDDYLINPRFLMLAMLKGGSLGVYGDFLFSQNNAYNKGMLATLTGPVIGFAEEIDKLTRGNILEALAGEETDFGAELVRTLKSNTPFANLWYTKAAMDRLIWNQLAEMAAPGAMRRVEQRTKQRTGQEYYWPLLEAIPERAPDFDAAVAP